ncbi:MAG: endolytic transglycosylase MltG [bacterium]|nr:endolytic transglycosylase MltG [bacterium]
MKKKVLIILIFISIVFIFKETIAIYVCDFIDNRAIKKNKYFIEQQVNIPIGKNTKEIAKILKDRKVIFSKLRFIVLAKMLRIENKLKSGEYKFNSKMTTFQIIEKLQKGEVISHRFTIPEGYNIRKIAGFLAKEKLIDKDRFLNLCYDVSFLKESDQKNCISLEGYLFPDTYKIALGLKEEDIIQTMLKRFYEVTGDIYEDRAQKVGLSFRKAVILASLIEKEAKAPEEREMISAVFHNRLKRRMPLSSCATVIYSLGKHKRRLYYKDLKIISPYNTYLRIGLPPGPICNPGKEALQAAVNPAPMDHLYFVSLGNGRHKFSRDYKQHVKARNAVK